MDEIQRAEKVLTQTIKGQIDAYINLSENVAQEFIKQKNKADSSSTVPSEVIERLEHEISVLENLKRSGIGIQQRMLDDVDRIIEEYSQLRNLLRAEKKIIAKDGQKSQQKTNNKSKNEQDDIQSQARSQDFSEQHPLDSNAFFLASQVQQQSDKKQKSFLKKIASSFQCNKIKKATLMSIEHFNYFLFLVFGILFLYFRFIKKESE